MRTELATHPLRSRSVDRLLAKEKQRSVQNTGREDSRDRQFPFSGHLQRPDHRYRNEQYRNVGY